MQKKGRRTPTLLGLIAFIRSAIVHPFEKNAFETPVSQPSMTIVGRRSELGSQSALSGMPSRSESGNQPKSLISARVRSSGDITLWVRSPLMAGSIN
jgi:hypothetical protein